MFVLIQNARVFAPEDRGRQDVLICNEQIVEIAPHIDFQWNRDEFQVIDAEGKYLVPGFIDQHVHIIGGGGEDGFASLIREIQMTDCVMRIWMKMSTSILPNWKTNRLPIS